mgnify:CR=1 FL=1
MTTSDFPKGTQVRLKPGEGELGTFCVFTDVLGKDGSVTVYGGDVDPGGYRSFRSFMPDRLTAEHRPEILRKLKRHAHG